MCSKALKQKQKNENEMMIKLKMADFLLANKLATNNSSLKI